MVASRRHFLKVSAVVGAGLATGGAIVKATTPTSTPINVRAGRPTSPADRGEQIQIYPPPPKHWDPGDFMMRVDVVGQKMAFTFDDGPSPANTYSVLRSLANANVKATFFLIGVNVRAYPQIARDIASEGHELGNHSIFHTPYRASSLASQIAGNNQIIQAETGVRPVANRAPGLTRGSSVLDTCVQENMYECHTHMATSDWVAPRWSASSLVSQFSSTQRTGAFAIYHDGGNRRPTPAAVPRMISIAQSRGYELMTATELVNAGSPVPGNQTYPAYGGLQIARGEGDGHLRADDEFDLFNFCQFDARAALVERLEDPTVTAAERSRIVEQLAMFDDHAQLDNS
ncbi:MAG: peptidoglycan/xylan/chitin deacetylase (PgdA/CDA1 family) [Gammaproteobacteria bacterium]|jgi:peptidoglycan/xylan/chitin deacetylase (PgdA/CDA1 family)